jgi:hypothetical protein
MLVAGFVIALVRYETARSGRVAVLVDPRYDRRVSDATPPLARAPDEFKLVSDEGQVYGELGGGVGVEDGDDDADDTGGVLLLPPPPPHAASEIAMNAAVSVRKRASSLKSSLPVR